MAQSSPERARKVAFSPYSAFWKRARPSLLASRGARLLVGCVPSSPLSAQTRAALVWPLCLSAVKVWAVVWSRLTTRPSLLTSTTAPSLPLPSRYTPLGSRPSLSVPSLRPRRRVRTSWVRAPGASCGLCGSRVAANIAAGSMTRRSVKEVPSGALTSTSMASAPVKLPP